MGGAFSTAAALATEEAVGAVSELRLAFRKATFCCDADAARGDSVFGGSGVFADVGVFGWLAGDLCEFKLGLELDVEIGDGLLTGSGFAGAFAFVPESVFDGDLADFAGDFTLFAGDAGLPLMIFEVVRGVAVASAPLTAGLSVITVGPEETGAFSPLGTPFLALAGASAWWKPLDCSSPAWTLASLVGVDGRSGCPFDSSGSLIIPSTLGVPSKDPIPNADCSLTSATPSPPLTPFELIVALPSLSNFGFSGGSTATKLALTLEVGLLLLSLSLVASPAVDLPRVSGELSVDLVSKSDLRLRTAEGARSVDMAVGLLSVSRPSCFNMYCSCCQRCT